MNRTAAAMSVFDEMTRDFAANKDKAKSAGLTPVGIESKGPLDRQNPGLSFPHDDPQTVKEAILHAMRALGTIRADLDHVQEGLEKMAPLYGLLTDADALLDAVTVPKAEPITKHVDMRDRTVTTVATADTDFDIRFAAMSEAAQAATFADAPAESEPVPGWVCPVHPDAPTTEETSRKGRKYRQCTLCARFEPA